MLPLLDPARRKLS
jgi:hypothetical protein